MTKNKPGIAANWTVEQCREYLIANGLPLPERDPWTATREELMEWHVEDCGTDTFDSLDWQFPGDKLRDLIVAEMNREGPYGINGLDEFRAAVEGRTGT